MWFLDNKLFSITVGKLNVAKGGSAKLFGTPEVSQAHSFAGLQDMTGKDIG